MADWVPALLAAAVGVPLLGAALWLDIRQRGHDRSSPVRGSAAVDALVPHYVLQHEVDAMPPPGRGREPGRPGEGRRLAFGHLHPDFATAGQVAEVTNASVLMVADEVRSMRELLAPLGGASALHPLVVVAVSFHPEVVATLRANRRATALPVVAAEANPGDLLELQGIVGGEVLSGDDLKSGWVPKEALGRASSWWSDIRSARVVGASADGTAGPAEGST